MLAGEVGWTASPQTPSFPGRVASDRTKVLDECVRNAKTAALMRWCPRDFASPSTTPARRVPGVAAGADDDRQAPGGGGRLQSRSGVSVRCYADGAIRRRLPESSHRPHGVRPKQLEQPAPRILYPALPDRAEQPRGGARIPRQKSRPRVAFRIALLQMWAVSPTKPDIYQ
jgi:hypothetical protein